MTTQATLDRHLRALTEGVDAIMRDYTDASVIHTPDGPLRGAEAVRAFFHGFLVESPPELARAMTLVHQAVEGEIAYVVWKAEPFIPLAADTFLIRDGKILVQTVTLFTPPSAR
jgi:hypothetical protein